MADEVENLIFQFPESPDSNAECGDIDCRATARVIATYVIGKGTAVSEESVFLCHAHAMEMLSDFLLGNL